MAEHRSGSCHEGSDSGLVASLLERDRVQWNRRLVKVPDGQLAGIRIRLGVASIDHGDRKAFPNHGESGGIMIDSELLLRLDSVSFTDLHELAVV